MLITDSTFSTERDTCGVNVCSSGENADNLQTSIDAGGQEKKCRDASDSVAVDAKTIDRWWEAWWGHPTMAVGRPPRVLSRQRLSLRHGVKIAVIGDYVNELRTDLFRRVLGKETTWVPVTPRLGEWFTLTNELGSGHYGTVMLCQERCTGKKFACKTVLKSSLMSIEEVDELCTEVSTMLHLQSTTAGTHENLLQFHELFDENDAVHLIVDYCAGGDLFDRIKKSRRLGERDAAQIFRQVVRGIMQMHSFGYIHRDLKPENILLTSSGTPRPGVKVGDFGLSKQLRLGEKTKGATGTLYYVAPEVLINEGYDYKADVWSLGTILYTCLSGRLPFWAETDEGIIGCILAARPSFYSKPWRKISPEAKSLVLGMLHPNPKRRMSLHNVLSSDWITRFCCNEQFRLAVPAGQAMLHGHIFPDCILQDNSEHGVEFSELKHKALTP